MPFNPSASFHPCCYSRANQLDSCHLRGSFARYFKSFHIAENTRTRACATMKLRANGENMLC
jgi:hypothetical protein